MDMATEGGFSGKNSELYLGSAPSEQDSDIIPSFTAEGFVPLAWFFFFTPTDLVSRQSINPKSWQSLVGEKDGITDVSLDNVDHFMKEPVMLRTTLPEAKACKDSGKIWN